MLYFQNWNNAAVSVDGLDIDPATETTRGLGNCPAKGKAYNVRTVLTLAANPDTDCEIIIKNKGSVSGTVVDEFDNPVAGAILHAQGQTVTADSDGCYTIENLTAGEIQMGVTATGFIPKTENATIFSGSNFKTLTISHNSNGNSYSNISGIVTDNSDGSPVSGVTVTIGSNNAVTDDNGYYIIYGVPGSESSYPVSAAAGDFNGYNGSITNFIDGAATHNFSITALPGGGNSGEGGDSNPAGRSITGVVCDIGTGNPISGVTVRTNVPGGSGYVSTTSGANGAFTLSGGLTYNGTYVVEFKHADYIYTSQNIRNGSACKQSNMGTVNMQGMNGIFKGSVTDQNGNGLGGVTISLAGRTIGSTDSSIAGNFYFDKVRTGEKSFVFSKTGYNSKTLKITIANGDTNGDNIIKLLPNSYAAVSGTVLKKGSNPLEMLEGVKVTASIPQSDFSVSATTTSNGEFSLSNIPVSATGTTATITYYKNGYGSESQKCTLKPGDNSAGSVEMGTSGKVYLAVQKVSLPLSGVAVSLNGNQLGTTDADGFVCLTLAAGSHNLQFAKTGYITKTQTVTVADGIPTPDLIYMNMLVDIYVETTGGMPIEGASIKREGNPIGVTNSIGLASLALSSGTYDLEFVKEGYQSKTETVTVSIQGVAVPDVVRLEQGDIAPLDGRVYADYDGSRHYLAGVEVQICSWDGFSPNPFIPLKTTTNAGGYYSFDDVAPYTDGITYNYCNTSQTYFTLVKNDIYTQPISVENQIYIGQQNHNDINACQSSTVGVLSGTVNDSLGSPDSEASFTYSLPSDYNSEYEFSMSSNGDGTYLFGVGCMMPFLGTGRITAYHNGQKGTAEVVIIPFETANFNIQMVQY